MSQVESTNFPKELTHFYRDLNREIGSGGFAKVMLAEHLFTKEKVAVKIMNKKAMENDLPRAYREIGALKLLRHQHICQLYHTHEDDNNIYLIMEYVSGGELFDYIVSKQYLYEKEARSIFRQVVSGVAYIHSHEYAHRDLKPENILLDEYRNVKLIDFGLCANPSGGLISPLDTCCGSPAYAAPELLFDHRYLGSEADVWSMGVLLFTLLCGYLPFDHEDPSVMYELIKTGQYDTPPWLSEEAVSLLKKMLEADPKKRITVIELLKDPWMMIGYGSPVTYHSMLLNQSLDKVVIAELSNSINRMPFETENLLKKERYNELTTHYELILRRKARQGVFRQKRSYKAFPTTTNKNSSETNETSNQDTTVSHSICDTSEFLPSQFHSVQDEKSTNNALNNQTCIANSIDNHNMMKPHTMLADSIYEYFPPMRDNDENSFFGGSYENLNPHSWGVFNTPLRPEKVPLKETVCSDKPEGIKIKPFKNTKKLSLSTNDLHLMDSSVRRQEEERKTVNFMYEEIPDTRKSTSNNCPRTPIGTNFPNQTIFSGNENNNDHLSSETSGTHQTTQPTTPFTPRSKARFFGRLFDFLSKKTPGGSHDNDSKTTRPVSTPRKIKTAGNIVVMSTRSPIDVRTELERVLLNMKQRDILAAVEFQKFSFKCKKEQRGKKVVFELEICLLPGIGESTVGIRRKRIRGDSWLYKLSCDQIFSAIKI